MINLLKNWLNRPVTLTVLLIIIFLLGGASIYYLPLDLSPSVEFPRLTISTYFPESTPEMIESLISAPIESRMQELPDVRNIKSVSSKDFSRVTLEFDRKADMRYTLFQVNELLADYKNWLPKEVYKPDIQKYIPDEFEQSAFLSYRLLSGLPENQLYELVNNKIKRPLINVQGVAAIDIFGLRSPVVEILVDLKKLKQYKITPYEIRQCLHAAEDELGIVRKNDYRLSIKLSYKFNNIQEVKKTPLKKIGGGTIYLKDVADVMQNYRKLRYKKRIDGKHTLLITIEKESGSNTIGVADRVFETVKKIEQNLPKESSLLLVEDASSKMRKSLEELSLRSAIALFAIFFLLTIVLKRIRGALIILFSIILSVLTVFIFIYALDYSINLLTIAGLALGFGFMVDNAIIVFDNIERRENLSHIPQAASEVISPITAATVTTLAALLPFVFLTKEMQIYYIPFAVVVGVTLIASVLFSFLFVPAAFYHLYKNNYKPQKKTVFSKIEKVYRSVFRRLIKFRWIVIALTLLTFGLPLWLLPDSLDESKDSQFYNKYIMSSYNVTIGSSFYSKIREYSDPLLGGTLRLFIKYVDKGEIWQWGGGTYLMVYLRMPQGSDMGLSEKIILPFEQIALHQKGYGKIETTIGRSFANMRVDFPEETAYSAAPFILKDKLIMRATEVGGAAISVYGYGDGFSSGYGGASFNYRVKFLGYNYLELRKLAAKFKKRLERNMRIRNINIDASMRFSIDELFQLEMELDRAQLGLLGLKPNQVLPLMRLYTNESLGRERIQIGMKEELLNIKAKDFENTQIDELNNKWFQVEGVNPFRLSQFSKTSKKPVLAEIRRENQQYIRLLTFDFLGPYKFGKEYLKNVTKDFKLPVGYNIDHNVMWFFKEEEKENLYMVILLGLLLIYMVTAALYESFRDPFLIFLTIPSGLIGVFIIFFMFDANFGQSAYIGVLFISGIVVNNSIILINRFKINLKNGFSLIQAVTTGAAHHLKPVLLTTITTIFGFLPMALLAGQNSDDLWYSLALTGIGGMTASLFFILFVLPLMFYIVEKRNSGL